MAPRTLLFARLAGDAPQRTASTAIQTEAIAVSGAPNLTGAFSFTIG